MHTRVSDVYVRVSRCVGITKGLVPPALVLSQTVGMTKTLFALVAFVRLLSGVNTHVIFQMTRFAKALIAHITLKRFLSSVKAHMYDQS